MTLKARTAAAATGLALVAGLAACNNDKLPTVNNNPNSPTDAPASALFTNAVQTGVSRWLGSGYSLRDIGLVVQHFAENQYIGNDQYKGVAGSSLNGSFTGAYAGELEDLNIVIRKGKAANDASIWAPASVMQQWDFSYLTDNWGDVPYSQALLGDSSAAVLTPAYDPQQQIYNGIFTKLTTAAQALAGATSSGLGAADPIYAGSNAKWAKFANSLHARYALRVVNADPAKANAELTAAFNGPGGVFTSNADNAMLKWPGDGVFNNPWSDNFTSRDDDRMSKTLMDTLINYSDPRLPIYAMPTQANPAVYAGQPNGLTNSAAVAYSDKSSRPGAIFYPGPVPYGTGFYGGAGPKQPSYLMTYSELLFIKAEAAERGLGGLTAGQAAGFYNQAVTASMQQWGVSDQTKIDAYLAQPAIAYKGGTAGLKQIALQKWIALYTDAGTAWFEWRRTCYPVLKPGPNAIFSYVPRRILYPTSEVSVNGKNVTAAIASQGPDKNNTTVWWDKTSTAPTCQ